MKCTREICHFLWMHNAYGAFLQTFIRGLPRPRFGVLQPNSDVSQYFVVLNQIIDDTRN